MVLKIIRKASECGSSLMKTCDDGHKHQACCNNKTWHSIHHRAYWLQYRTLSFFGGGGNCEIETFGQYFHTYREMENVDLTELITSYI